MRKGNKNGEAVGCRNEKRIGTETEEGGRKGERDKIGCEIGKKI